ncbi:GrlR family regulatory protein [Roseovarius autotrophicus]|uniref:GrlR family regulatory protein n=1 Tax=Roseovarius autotrophicus TaxID=2824121 RepID=UPI001B39B9EE|nr:GrlR family regulatory protein [Roseovarius autotrophicus]
MSHNYDGTYTVQFKGSQDWGAGVITLKDLQLTGGDSGYIFTGSFREVGSRLVGTVRVEQHVEGYPSVFGPSVGKVFDLYLEGQFDGAVSHFHGHVLGQNHFKIQVHLARAHPLAAE